MIPHEPGTWMNRGPWRKRGYSRVRTQPFQESVPGGLEDDLRSDEGGGSIREFTGFTRELCYEHQSWDSRRPSTRRPSGIRSTHIRCVRLAAAGGCRFVTPKRISRVTGQVFRTAELGESN